MRAHIINQLMDTRSQPHILSGGLGEDGSWETRVRITMRDKVVVNDVVIDDGTEVVRLTAAELHEWAKRR